MTYSGTEYHQWEIWQVDWQHEDGTSKERPALLFSSDKFNKEHDELWFAQIRSRHLRDRYYWEFKTTDPNFRATGLTKSCFLYMTRVQKISKSKIRRYRGYLPSFAAYAVRALFEEAGQATP